VRSELLQGGVVFDGAGGPGSRVDLWLRDGRVAGLVAPGAELPADTVRTDVTGCWVLPGFVDCHTHYDAEVEVLPGLSESVRHGVTTVVIGSCGLSMAVGEPEDLADMFCRVEGIPRRYVLPLLQSRKTWSTAPEYLDHLRALPLGPNVASLLGHSALRAHVLGFGRSVDADVRPSPAELDRMAALLEEALDAGYLGLSINTLPWDKLDGERFRSRPTPSVFARWSEYRHLIRVLRRRDRVFQAVPDVSTKRNAAHFFWETTGLLRPPLKTMILTLFDTKADRFTMHLVGAAARFVNALGRGQLRLQSLPHPFDIWSDGLEVPVLEEVGAGTLALHVEDPVERAALLRDPSFRERFRREWRGVFGKAYHRDLDEARIVSCPDPTAAGRTFGEVARARGEVPEDTFLELAAEHGSALRWTSVVGNDRPAWVEWIAAHPAVMVGFSDAGAHLRNMAFYNFPLRLLKRVRDAEHAGRPFLTVGQAVRRVTGEIAEFLGLDTGVLAAGARADVVVVDPTGLDDAVEAVEEAEMPGFDGFRRMVRRNDRAIRGVWVNGHRAWTPDGPTPALGREALGTVLGPR
jgi:N-acyl-D-aspartate/D-glutamate deacylase